MSMLAATILLAQLKFKGGICPDLLLIASTAPPAAP